MTKNFVPSIWLPVPLPNQVSVAAWDIKSHFMRLISTLNITRNGVRRSICHLYLCITVNHEQMYRLLLSHIIKYINYLSGSVAFD